MAINETLNNRVRQSLAPLTNVEEKKMFRGTTFMINGKMCISAGDNELMLRIDPTLHEHVLQKKGCRSVIMKGREYRGYVYVNEDGFSNKKDWDYWISLALEFNKKTKATTKRK